VILFLAATAVAECTVPRTLVELDTSIGEAESSWGQSPASFAEAMGGARAVLGCVNQPLPGSTASRLLRLRGLEAFLGRDTPTAAAAFNAARAVDPAITLPDSMAPAGNPLRAVWDTQLDPGPGTALRGARRGQLYVDGATATSVPTERPFVFQWIDGVRVEGGITTADALPSYPRARHPAATPLMVASGVAAAAAVASYGLAWAARDEWEHPDGAESFESAYMRTNAFSIAAAGAGIGAVGLLGTSLVVARW